MVQTLFGNGHQNFRTSENFEHAVYTCPQVQYIMHRIKYSLNLDCDIKPSVVIFSCPRPPDATKKQHTYCLIIDIIWLMVMKIVLKNRSDGTRICEIQALTELKNNLEIIVRNFPTQPISASIIETNLIPKLSFEISAS